MALYDGYFFDESYDSTRFCYARARLLREATKQGPTVDAAMTSLRAPLSAAQRRRMTIAEKLEALEDHMTHLGRLNNSEWHKCKPEEIFAAGVFLSKLKSAEKAQLFWPVKTEEELRTPIRKWLEEQKLTAYDEVPMGQSRVDLVGYRASSFWGGPERIIAVELKNQLAQLKRGLDQMTNYSDYGHQVYLACTPALAASYLCNHFNAKEVGQWDPEALERKLGKFGLGLLLVEGEQVFEVRPAKSFRPDEHRLVELRAVIGRC